MRLTPDLVGMYDFKDGYVYRVRPVLVSGVGMVYSLQFRTHTGMWHGSAEENHLTFIEECLTKTSEEWRTVSEMRYYRHDGTAIPLTEQPRA